MTQMQVSEQQAWEERTGWVEDPSGSGRHPVRWVTGSRKQQSESWPMLSAWDHARPVARDGERAYLLMPYGISEFGEQQLSEWCAERGMRWEVLPGSGWWASGYNRHPGTLSGVTLTEDRKEAAIRYGVALDINPFVAILEEVRRSAGHVAWLGMKVAEAPFDDALLDTYAPWVRLYQQERDKLLKAADTAVKLGLEERVVRVEERRAGFVARVLLSTLEALDLPPEIRARAPQVLREQLLMLDAG